VDLLGTGVRSEVVRTWSEQHGGSLGRELEARLFGPLLQKLDAQVAAAQSASAAFSTAAEQLEGGDA
jgi:hypothetical protein